MKECATYVEQHPGLQARDVEETVQVANYLLRKRFYLTALEMHQELLERNGGVAHSIEQLNDIFTDQETLDSLLTQNEEEAKKAAYEGAGRLPYVLFAIDSLGCVTASSTLAMKQLRLRYQNLNPLLCRMGWPLLWTPGSKRLHSWSIGYEGCSQTTILYQSSCHIRGSN